jgi:hypothetical protein
LIYLKLGRPCRPLFPVRPHVDALAAALAALAVQTRPPRRRQQRRSALGRQPLGGPELFCRTRMTRRDIRRGFLLRPFAGKFLDNVPYRALHGQCMTWTEHNCGMIARQVLRPFVNPRTLATLTLTSIHYLCCRLGCAPSRALTSRLRSGRIASTNAFRGTSVYGVLFDFAVLLVTDAVLTGIAAKMYGRMGF